LFIRSNPVDCCVFLTGLFRDAASGVVEGACGPVLIHADKSKTKEKEAQERVRQRNGEAPDNMVTSERWTVELENIPDIRVQTTNSGSMTQEVFFVYAKHFVVHSHLNTNLSFFFLMGTEVVGIKKLCSSSCKIVSSPLFLQVTPVSGRSRTMLVLIKDFTVQ